MCNFKSGIVMRDQREKGGFKLFMSPWTESHHELETIFNLRGGTLTEMCGGTLTEIKEWFSGLVGKIVKPAKVLSDLRKKTSRGVRLSASRRDGPSPDTRRNDDLPRTRS